MHSHGVIDVVQWPVCGLDLRCEEQKQKNRVLHLDCLFHVSRGMERHAQNEASVELVIAFHQSKVAATSRTLSLLVSAASNASNGASSKAVLGMSALHACNSFMVPALLPKVSVSIPMFCSMVTKRLQSGLLLSRLKAKCWPCWRPPPARRIGRFVLS